VVCNDRLRRGSGITVRRMPDLIIGTYSVERGCALLHDDHDFEPVRAHLGWQVI
jgi:predicted nucleic acid-binding protein